MKKQVRKNRRQYKNNGNDLKQVRKMRKTVPKMKMTKKQKNNAKKAGLIERQGMRPNLSPGSHMSLSHNALDANAAASKYQETTQ